MNKVYLVTVGAYEIVINAPTRSTAKWRACAALANRLQSGDAARKLAVHYILSKATGVKRLPHLDGSGFDTPVICYATGD